MVRPDRRANSLLFQLRPDRIQSAPGLSLQLLRIKNLVGDARAVGLRAFGIFYACASHASAEDLRTFSVGALDRNCSGKYGRFHGILVATIPSNDSFREQRCAKQFAPGKTTAASLRMHCVRFFRSSPISAWVTSAEHYLGVSHEAPGGVSA